MIDRIKATANSFRKELAIFLNHCGDKDYLRWYFFYSQELLKFKDIHRGQCCFIIGNGPSLKDMDLSPLKNYHTFGLNKIFLLFDKVDLNLSYHVSVNQLVIEQSAKEFEQLSCPSFLSYRAAREHIRPNDHIKFMWTTGRPYMFQTDLSQSVIEGNTVTYVAMQIAFYMGFSKIFLIGVDHNFQVSGQPNEIQRLQGADPYHFDSKYFAEKDWQLPDLEASELSFHLARFHFERVGREIHDATVGGKLQIFPKISYELALDMCSRK